MAPRFDYDVEAARLAKAIEISIEAFLTHPPPDVQPEGFKQVIDSYRNRHQQVLEPSDAKFKTSRILKEYQSDAFTYFQEATGETVEFFWKRIQQEGLPYKRLNVLDKILKRGRIVRRAEYDVVQDVLVAAEQDGTISSEDAARLAAMLGEYEFAKRKDA